MKTREVQFEFLGQYFTFRANIPEEEIREVLEYLEEKKQEMLNAVKEAKLPRFYPDGNTSVRRGLLEAWSEEEETPEGSAMWNGLVYYGYAKSVAKAYCSPSILTGERDN